MTDTQTEHSIAVRKFKHGVKMYSDENCHAILWFKKGIKSLSVDFEQFSVQDNSVFFISSGRRVCVKTSRSPQGWILKFSRDFIRQNISNQLFVKNVEIYESGKRVPRIVLSPKIGERVHTIIEMIDELVETGHAHKEAASANLLKTLLLYCDSNCNICISGDDTRKQVSIVTTFKNLVAKNYDQIHSVTEYAGLMNISPKYLNQVVKEVLGITAKAIIQEQLLLQARRDLKFSDDSIKVIAYKLGFSDPFYFSNYFKKEMGYSPSEYRTM